MDKFWEEFETGEIHFRDKWQFELKSEFFPLPNKAVSEYTQEFYIFVPNALQVNSQTYTKNDFYQAQTSLIRFKTPEISFQELLNPNNEMSPLTKLKRQAENPQQVVSQNVIEGELKLFGNIFRSTILRQIYPIIIRLENAATEPEYLSCQFLIKDLFSEINKVLAAFKEIKHEFLEQHHLKQVQHIFEYVEDVISIYINTSVTGLLKTVRSKHQACLDDLDTEITQLLLFEKKIREEHLKEPSQLGKDVIHNEAILFQSGLLNKYMLDALQLRTERRGIVEKYSAWIGSLAAGIAMLLYLSLFIWQASLFVINSLSFVIFTVFIYVLKDRLKEELKALSYKQVFRWFPDYTTEILSPIDEVKIGKMHDSFGFINENQVPKDIWLEHNEGYQPYLDMIKLPEQVIYYKKRIEIHSNAQTKNARLGALSILFRYDIHKFMAKASNAYEPYTTIDSETLDLITTQLPKVYHINIVMKNSYLKPDLTPFVEWKKFRLVVDKEGIKRVESLVEDPKD